jgi:hypothetical protein
MFETNYVEEATKETHPSRGVTEIQLSSVQREGLYLCILFSMLDKASARRLHHLFPANSGSLTRTCIHGQYRVAGGGPLYVATLIVTMLDLASLLIYGIAFGIQRVMRVCRPGARAADARAWWIDLADDLLVEVPALTIALINACSKGNSEGICLTVFSLVKLLKHAASTVSTNCRH